MRCGRISVEGEPEEIAFSPKPRSRQRHGKRSNPYSARGLDKFKIVYAELSARREYIANKTGAPEALVRFVYSKNGWIPVVVRGKEGTLGYMASELTWTGKATPSSDVFSFGVLLLEVACVRRPVDPLKNAEQMILAEWAWDLYTEGRLLEASDPKLGKRYDVGEMEKVLTLELLCCHPEPESRLGMRHVCQILEGEAPLADLCTTSYNMTLMGSYPGVLFSYTGD